MQEKGLSTSAKMATKNPKLIKAECYIQTTEADAACQMEHNKIWDLKVAMFGFTTLNISCLMSLFCIGQKSLRRM